MDKTELALNVSTILLPILMSGLAWLGARAVTLINARVKNEWLKGALVRLDDAVLAVVRELQQTTVDAIKEAAKDGKITDEERARIKDLALASVKSHLGAKGLGELAKVLGLDDGSLGKLISSKIEAAVYAMKLEQTAVASNPPKP